MDSIAKSALKSVVFQLTVALPIWILAVGSFLFSARYFAKPGTFSKIIEFVDWFVQ